MDCNRISVGFVERTTPVLVVLDRCNKSSLHHIWTFGISFYIPGGTWISNHLNTTYAEYFLWPSSRSPVLLTTPAGTQGG